jgi:hypothetical protein
MRQGETLAEGQQLLGSAGQDNEIAFWGDSYNAGKELKTMRPGSLKYPVRNMQIDSDAGAL